MKRISFLLSCFAIAATGYAQQSCNSSHPLFKFEHMGTPHEVHTLGSNPEFPFLRDKSSPEQFTAAMKRNANADSRGMRELDDIIKQLGYDGVGDVPVSAVSATYIPSGTRGNMGNGNYSYQYSRLAGDSRGYKAWKITAPSGCYVYICSKCGNAFYPYTGEEQRTAAVCKETNVSISSVPREITVNTDPAKHTREDNTYIYYHRKNQNRNEDYRYSYGVPDDAPSRPLMIRTKKVHEPVPEKYTVTVSPANEKVAVCPGKEVKVAANINVEYTSEYAGYDTRKVNKQYREVSKRTYKKTARKLRKAENKLEKASELTDVRVNNLDN